MVTRRCLGLLGFGAFALALLSACSQARLDVRPIDTGGGMQSGLFERFYDAAKQQISANHLGLAIVDLNRALAVDPRSVRALNATGACYDGLHRYDIAMGFYKQALDIDPQSAETFNNMAVSLLMAGSRAEGQEMLRKAASLAPDDRMIQFNVARAGGDRKNGEAAQANAPVETAAATIGASRPQVQGTDPQSYPINVTTGSASTVSTWSGVPFDLRHGESLPAVPLDADPVEAISIPSPERASRAGAHASIGAIGSPARGSLERRDVWEAGSPPAVGASDA